MRLFPESADLPGLIVREIRLPCIILAMASPGLSRAALQGLLRNPLAEPGLLDVTSGASLGAVIAIYFGFASSIALATPLFALTGAFVTAGIALILARTGGTLALAVCASTSIAGSVGFVSLIVTVEINRLSGEHLSMLWHFA